MYYEYNYGICSELYSDCSYSSRYPHRKRFATQEEVDKWIEEMNEKYGETGWRLGDENIHQGEMPTWPRCKKSWAEIDREVEESIANVGRRYEQGETEFEGREKTHLEIYLMRRSRHRREES